MIIFLLYFHFRIMSYFASCWTNLSRNESITNRIHHEPNRVRIESMANRIHHESNPWRIESTTNRSCGESNLLSIRIRKNESNRIESRIHESNPETLHKSPLPPFLTSIYYAWRKHRNQERPAVARSEPRCRWTNLPVPAFHPTFAKSPDRSSSHRMY